MKLKRKTELRKRIKNSIGTVGSFDNLWIFPDGEWEIYSSSTCPADREVVDIQSMTEFTGFYPVNDWAQRETDKAITNFFRSLEW